MDIVTRLAKLRFWWSTRCVGCKKRFRFGSSSRDADGPKRDIFYGWHHADCFASIVNQHVAEMDRHMTPQMREDIKASAQALASAIDENIAASVYANFGGETRVLEHVHPKERVTVLTDGDIVFLARQARIAAAPAVEQRRRAGVNRPYDCTKYDKAVFVVQNQFVRGADGFSVATENRWLLIDGVPHTKADFLAASAIVGAALTGKHQENWMAHHALIEGWPEESILLTAPEDQP